MLKELAILIYVNLIPALLAPDLESLLALLAPQQQGLRGKYFLTPYRIKVCVRKKPSPLISLNSLFSHLRPGYVGTYHRLPTLTALILPACTWVQAVVTGIPTLAA